MTQEPDAETCTAIETTRLEVSHPSIKRWHTYRDTTFSTFMVSAARAAKAARVVEIGCEYGLHLGAVDEIAYTGVDYGYFIEFASQLRTDRQWVKLDFDRYDSALFSVLYDPDAIYVVRERLEHVRDPGLLLDCLADFARRGQQIVFALDASDGPLPSMFRRRVRADALAAAFRGKGLVAAPVGHVPSPQGPPRSRLQIAVVGAADGIGAALSRILRDLDAPGARHDVEPVTDGDLTPETMLFDPSLPLLSSRRAPTLNARTPHLDADAVAARVLEAKRVRRPFSLVRLGNGEGRVLGFPDFVPPIWLGRSLRNWFGPRAAGLDVRHLQDEAGRAINEADLIGVARDDPDLHRLLALHALEVYGLTGERAAYCAHDVHLTLLESPFFTELLNGECRVSLICGHELSDSFASAFAISDLRLYKVPAQAKFFFDERDEPHLPVVFERLRDTIEVREPGEIFLVGAGFLGKIYCGWIKQRGGIALDVGSVFDLWAGEATRSGFAGKLARFQLP